MPDADYDNIVQAWSDEMDNDELQDLEDLRFSKMVEYLSKIRLTLAETSAENELLAGLLTQEVLNLEFMLKDLLIMRRDKIVKVSIAQRRPLGAMTLSEEELYNRLIRGFEGHHQFINETLVGTPTPTMKRSKSKKKTKDTKEPDTLESDEIEYVLVRFLKPIPDAFLGLDEMTYGPFAKDDIGTIPTDNARMWLRDGTVTRVTIEGQDVSD
ncbi:MAG: hypothetical protein RTU92_14195 [Candidatus Thorarchaeota archaeon]